MFGLIQVDSCATTASVNDVCAASRAGLKLVGESAPGVLLLDIALSLRLGIASRQRASVASDILTVLEPDEIKAHAADMSFQKVRSATAVAAKPRKFQTQLASLGVTFLGHALGICIALFVCVIAWRGLHSERGYTFSRRRRSVPWRCAFVPSYLPALACDWSRPLRCSTPLT